MKRGVRRGVYLLPSLFTIGSLLCGVYAVVSVYNDEYRIAAVAILLAFVLDGLDGAVARLTGTQTDIGLQLDSLADLVSFGVAPALLAYVWAVKPYTPLGWLFGSIVPTALFVCCGAFRLARFNIQTRTLDKRYFVGLPIPAAAGVIASFILFMRDSPSLVLFERELLSPQMSSVFIIMLVYLLSLLMVSRVRYRSMKGMEMKRQQPFAILLSLTFLLLLVASHPSLVIFTFFCVYAASGPVRFLLVPHGRGSAETAEGRAIGRRGV